MVRKFCQSSGDRDHLDVKDGKCQYSLEYLKDQLKVANAAFTAAILVKNDMVPP